MLERNARVNARCSLQWRHNELDGVSNHQRHEADIKKSKLRATGPCEGNWPVTGEFPTQRSSNAEKVSIWWRHHVRLKSYCISSRLRWIPLHSIIRNCYISQLPWPILQQPELQISRQSSDWKGKQWPQNESLWKLHGLFLGRCVCHFKCANFKHTLRIYIWSIVLTHWGRDKMDAISQTTSSSAFSWMKMFEFRLKFQWSLFPRAQLTIFQHWFR